MSKYICPYTLTHQFFFVFSDDSECPDAHVRKCVSVYKHVYWCLYVCACVSWCECVLGNG